jgi:hypothetical protein
VNVVRTTRNVLVEWTFLHIRKVAQSMKRFAVFCGRIEMFHTQS